MTDRYGDTDTLVEPDETNEDNLFQPEGVEPEAGENPDEDGDIPGTEGTPATEVVTETKAEEAKPAGPTKEEVDAAVEAFKVYLVGQEFLDTADDESVDTVEGGILVSDERDPSTGIISDALKAQIKDEYIKLPAGQGKDSARARVKDWANSLVEASIMSLEKERARTFFTVHAECLNAKGANAGGGITQKQVDPVEEHLERVVSLYLAPYLLADPEAGLPDDFSDRVNTRVEELTEKVTVYKAWLHGDAETRGDEPEVPAEVKAAGRVATGKTNRSGGGRPRKAAGDGTQKASYSGPQRNVAAHVTEFFGGEVGKTALLGAIAKFDSAEYGNGADHPSGGAVTARIWPSDGQGGYKPSSIPGVEQCMLDGKKAARWIGV